VEVFGGVFVLGGIAAADVAALHAEAEMNPGISTLDTFSANMHLGVGDLNLLEMRTLLCHSEPP
jgi:hypothetical protein